MCILGKVSCRKRSFCYRESINDWHIVEALKKNTNTPARILKTDAIHAAVEEYARKLGVE